MSEHDNTKRPFSGRKGLVVSNFGCSERVNKVRDGEADVPIKRGIPPPTPLPRGGHNSGLWWPFSYSSLVPSPRDHTTHQSHPTLPSAWLHDHMRRLKTCNYPFKKLNCFGPNHRILWSKSTPIGTNRQLAECLVFRNLVEAELKSKCLREFLQNIP